MKKHNLVIVSTYQEPHFTDFYTLNKFINIDSIVYCDARKNISFRVDEARINDPVLTKLSKAIRNSIFGFIKSFFYKNKFLFFHSKFNIKFYKSFIIEDKDFLIIWKAYRSYTINKSKRSFINFNLKDFNKIKNDFLFAKHLSQEIIAEKCFSTIFIFNGRFPFEFFLVNELKKNSEFNIKYIETNQYCNKLIILDHSPHDLAAFDTEIHKYSDLSDPINLINDSKSLIEIWKAKFTQFPISSLGNTVIFFTGSMDEYEFFYDNFFNQAKFIIELDKALKIHGISLLVRVHPNTREKSLNTQEFWRFFKLSNPSIVICFSDDLSSYQLIEECLFSISTGSSIAPQSFLINKKHVVLGNYSYYSKLNCIKILEPHSLLNIIRSSKTYELMNFVDCIPTISSMPNFSRIVASSLLFERHLGFDRSNVTFSKNPMIIKTVFDSPSSFSDRKVELCSKIWLYFCSRVSFFSNYESVNVSNFLFRCFGFLEVMISDSDYLPSVSIDVYEGDLVSELSYFSSEELDYLALIFVSLSRINPLNELNALDRLSLSIEALNG